MFSFDSYISHLDGCRQAWKEKNCYENESECSFSGDRGNQSSNPYFHVHFARFVCKSDLTLEMKVC